MKKLFQILFSFKNIEVYNIDTKQKEKAQYRMILGIPYKITYTPMKESVVYLSVKDLTEVMSKSILLLE